MADPRFSALSSDPRYRLPSRKEARTAVDPRFGRLFTDQDFRKKASVDRYGRKIKPEEGKRELEKLYKLEKEQKPARESEERKVVGSEDDSEASDEDVRVEKVLVGKRDPARDGGFSESESEETSSEEEEGDVEAELAEETAGQEQTEDIPMGEVSHRIAAVNLDWDNIRASDIMAVASSFVPSSGRIERVTVYPSEFGRERLEREEMEGPPRDIFASSKRAPESESDEEGDAEDWDDEDEDEKIKRRLLEGQADEGAEFDTAALRQYQLERLRYYYAVITCGNKATAKHLYDSMDGREYLNTANFFDLRFIPDDTSFDDDRPRDECEKLPDGYTPNEFRTEALTHSKVRLTWDDDDTTRKEVQKRAFSRGEIEENDLQAYIGSESSDAESVSSRKSTAEDRKAKKKAAQREKMRAALGLGDEPKAGKAKKGSGKEEPVGDMQITFTSGLIGGRKSENGVFENEPQDEESTRARYIRKEKERKQKRKERAKATRPGAATADEAQAETGANGDAGEGEAEEAGFDDPFFADPGAAAVAEKKARKAARQQKREAQAAKDAEHEARRKELELLMAEDQADHVRHFDMRDVEKSEKEARRKGKKGKKPKKQADDKAVVGGAGEEGFAVQTEDPRFKALFESHEFAIDPTNPRYKGTEGMKALLEEGRRKRKRVDHDAEGGEEVGGKKSKKADPGGKAGDDELKGLVARLKTKKTAK